MRVLFATSTPFLSEPLGVMLLSAICREAGHATRLTILREERLADAVAAWRPDVVAYSAMSTEAALFEEADRDLRERLAATGGRRVFRVMGGAHPTYWPAVVEEMQLDAVCQGDGDRAFPALLERLERGEPFDDVPNVATTRAGARTRELVEDLDALPFAHRADYYAAAPYVVDSGLRSFVASRGCPYDCTYCYNHAFKEMFRGCGPILRRRSVDDLLTEIEQVVREHPPVRLIRFGDDTFAHTVDAWLEEFAEQYPRRIGKPFYCLMRSNTLTDDAARLLAQAGCRSVGMSLEAGSERIRNDILKRRLSDEVVVRSFATAKKYGLKEFANSMVGVPGTTLADDFETLEFARRIKPAAPYFGVCVPYAGTEIWRMAVDQGLLAPDAKVGTRYLERSVLNNYTEAEKRTQARLCYLGSLYCHAPRFALPFLRGCMRRMPLRLANRLGMIYANYRLSTRIFPQGIPRSPRSFVRLVRDTLRIFG